MALSTEKAAYNTALIALITAHKAVIDAGTAKDVLQMVAVDVGQDATVNTGTHATAVGNLVTMGTGPRPSFGEIHSWNLVDDGEFPITLPNGKPLFYAYTDQAHALA